VLLDAANAPALTPLVQVERVRVVAQPLDLDMAGARLEISQDAGGLDTPGGKFRHLFVKLSNALGEGKLPEALALGQSALGIAEDQQWFALAVPIHFSLGAALAGNGQVTQANQHYLQAELAAVEGEKAGDPVCTKLRAQARMARGGLLIGIQQYPAAAKLFIETRALASAAEDPRMVIDCCRLASFAFERSGRYEQAWQAGADGLGYAKDLDAETRQTSNLAYLGEGMMRLTKRSEYSTLSQRIEREMVALLGTKDWRPKAAPPPPGAAASASP
jgi:hypothetical protein